MPKLIQRVAQRMEVVGSDGDHVGVVDAVDGDNAVRLARRDVFGHGDHHWIPLDWVDRVDGNVVFLGLTGREAREQWLTSLTN